MVSNLLLLLIFAVVLSISSSFYVKSVFLNSASTSINFRQISNFQSRSNLKTQLSVAEIAVFGDEDITDESSEAIEKPKTHGYEGDFQVGDIVRVKKPIRIWSVKQHAKEGFSCEGFVGTVSALVLYGRKYQTLCSAITPIKVDFQPNGEGIPPNMFEKKWIAHFAANELELLSRAPPPSLSKS
mmetsp:Transcript_28232/g.38863  ORF Transcript_28232/g.38863 Transcript_28232/m.38863 type:complete len:184 (+) Transcript_28232:16-567(+)